MFVVDADQIDSSRRPDLVEPALRDLAARYGTALVGPERTVGDELQFAAEDAGVALDAALRLLRTRDWSVGIGVGAVDEPASASVREMRGPAFLRARDAVDAAKRRPQRVCVDAGPAHRTIDPVVRLLVALRDRRTAEGWELADVLDAEPGLTLTDAAARLGISPSAASQRAANAELRLDGEVRAAITALLERADAEPSGAAATVG